MQGLSSRAHAFSVEALVGKPCKRRKTSARPDVAGVNAEVSGDADTFTSETGSNGPLQFPSNQSKSAAGTPQGQKDSELGREGRKIRVGDETSCGEAQRSGQSGDPRVDLQGSELWNRFYEIGTEMIITKAGRRMFPSVRVKVRNLDPCQQYYIAMDVMPVDSKRYRYVYHSSQWMVAGNTDHSCISPRLYVHPDSPCAGETWMRQVISFDRVKLTNNEMDDKGHVILQSMHKYKPRVHVIRHDPRADLSQMQTLPAEGVHSFSFPETEFTTVTAYQNQQITKLKIDRNPFAKGFRDPGRNRGVLDGLLESYPWRGPLNLDFKPFTLQLHGSPHSLGSSGSSLKSLLPLSPPPSHPFCLSSLGHQDAGLHALSLPLYGKSSGGPLLLPPLAGRGFSSLGPDRLRALPHFSPLADLSFLSALQAKKAAHCKDPHLQGPPPGTSSCLVPLQGPFGPRGPGSASLAPHLGDPPGPYCVYRYSLPLGPHFAALSCHGVLAQDAADRLLRRSPWLPAAANQCL
ncbi:T-box transcription factor TBX22 [Gadus morhua]|uniref:T-box transcription factor 22 n=1 Tax=Gadus morhua TaxID=8049 RepID=A0A8C5A7P6_GADMO|nr:T-box transcription factor TBX22 [Gadus morhua]